MMRLDQALDLLLERQSRDMAIVGSGLSGVCALVAAGYGFGWITLALMMVAACFARLAVRSQRRIDSIFARALEADLAEGNDPFQYAEAA